MPKKVKRSPWSREACWECGNEGLASRAEPEDGPYICGDCEMYRRGYNEAISTEATTLMKFDHEARTGGNVPLK